MLSEEQKKELSSIFADIVPNKHYWFFRTMGGYYYDEFINGGFIALSYNEILTNSLRDLPANENSAREHLKRKLKDSGTYTSKSHIAKAAGQILKFYRDMNKGDMVVIPSSNSREYAIGIVDGDMYEEMDIKPTPACQFIKRRKVKWQKKVSRRDLDAAFLLGLGNQQTMSCIDKYSDFIDRKIDPLYMKGNRSYLVLRVNQDKGLTWNDFCVIADLAKLLEDVTKKFGEDVDVSQFSMKINVQSTGDIIMSCANDHNYYLAIVIMIVSIILLGGEVNLRLFKIKSNGVGPLIKQIFDAIASYKNAKTEEKFKEMQMRLMNMKLDGIKESDARPAAESSEESPSPSSPSPTEDGNGQTEPQ